MSRTWTSLCEHPSPHPSSNSLLKTDSIHIHEPMASVYAVALSPTIEFFKLAPVLADNSLLKPVVPNHLRGSSTPSLKGRRRMLSRLRHQLLQTRRRAKASLKVRSRRASLQPRVVMLTSTRLPRMSRTSLKTRKMSKKTKQKFILLMPRLPRVRWSQMTCLIGLQASARITKTVRLRQLRVHLLQPLQKLWVTGGNGGVLVVLREYIDKFEDAFTLLLGKRVFGRNSLSSLRELPMSSLRISQAEVQ